MLDAGGGRVYDLTDNLDATGWRANRNAANNPSLRQCNRPREARRNH